MKQVISSKQLLGRLGLTCLFILMSSPSAAKGVVDLTMEVAGDLLQHGGVVTVYPIPVPPIAGEAGVKPPAVIRLDSRYNEVQLQYPANGTFVYRFRSSKEPTAAANLPTQVLSVIGVDQQQRGPQMKIGFKDAYSSGGRVIRVLPAAEYSGQDEHSRTHARWGITEGNQPPPADERSARALPLLDNDDAQLALQTCTGANHVRVCVLPAVHWPKLDSLWWRNIAGQRLERLQHYALRRCHDNSTTVGICRADPNSNEPDFVKRAKPVTTPKP